MNYFGTLIGVFVARFYSFLLTVARSYLLTLSLLLIVDSVLYLPLLGIATEHNNGVFLTLIYFRLKRPNAW